LLRVRLGLVQEAPAREVQPPNETQKFSAGGALALQKLAPLALQTYPHRKGKGVISSSRENKTKAPYPLANMKGLVDNQV